MAERPLSKQRPYLLRAMHEWMTDNALTPHLVVDAKFEGIDLPVEHVRDNKLVLNVSYAATRALVIGNDAVTFEARFGGVPRSLHVPVDAVLGIYARENGQGMVFSEGPEPEPPSPDDDGPKEDGSKESKRPSLRVVK
jgi:stringent starvation protein B